MPLLSLVRVRPAVLVTGLAAGALTLTSGASRPAGAQQPVAPDPAASTINVAAVGEADVTPDRARVSIGVRTRAATAADASAENARLQRAVVDTIRGLGVAAEQITTSGYSVFPEQVYEPTTRRSRVTGYNVQNTVIVELRRVEQVGSTLDAALSKGANLVSSLQFYSSQAELVRRRALQNAVVRARADAEAIAAAAGGRLGDLLGVDTDAFSGFPPPPAPAPMDASVAEARAAAPTVINQGTQRVAVTVNTRWRFVPTR